MYVLFKQVHTRDARKEIFASIKYLEKTCFLFNVPFSRIFPFLNFEIAYIFLCFYLEIVQKNPKIKVLIY